MMVCYKDITFCRFWEECKIGKECYRALKPNVKKRAEEIKLPICEFAEYPKCFMTREKK